MRQLGGRGLVLGGAFLQLGLLLVGAPDRCPGFRGLGFWGLGLGFRVEGLG